MPNKDEVQERVIKVTAEVLKTDPSEISPEANFIFDLGAESIDSVALVAAFEKEFDIEMDEDSALEVQSIDGAVNYIMGYLENK